MTARIAVALLALTATLAGCGDAAPTAQPSEALAPGDKAAKGTGRGRKKARVECHGPKRPIWLYHWLCGESA